MKRLALITLTFAVALLGATATSAWSVSDRARPKGQEEDKQARTAPSQADVTPADLRFQQHRLRYGTPRQAHLLAEPLDQMSSDLRRFLAPSPTHPLYAGGVVLASRHGVVPVHDAAGKALRYTDTATELPADQQVAMRRDTIFDLASVTKTFTTIAVLQQVEAGRVDLDEPVATYLPDFAQHGKDDVTVRHLLTHTGGLPAWLPLYSAYPTVEERLAAVLAVEPDAEPGEAYVYSDLSLITLGLVVEEVTARSLDHVIAHGITRPLRMTDTMFNPPAHLVGRIAATEAQPWAGRPMIRGEVHDENAWSLGGVAGHAGLFSTARDLAVLARTLLNGGRYGHARILETDTVRAMLVNENAEFPGDSHGLGFELDQRWYMDGLSTPVTFGHTGYTGTSVVIDPMSDSFVILLTNRVHPSRDWGSNNPARRAVARDLGRAIAVRPIDGREAWFSGIGDARTVTLTAPAAGQRADVRALVRHRGRLRRPHPRGLHRRRVDLDPGAVRAPLGSHHRRHHLRVRRASLAPRRGGACRRATTSSCAGGTPPTRPTRVAACTSTACALDGKRIPDDDFAADGWTRSPN